MSGKLIFVSGLSGAGKTTLLADALKELPGVKYLKTYTTRPMRAAEVGSFEYVFVDDDEYEVLRTASRSWDHTDYAGYKYGADVDRVKAELAGGTCVVCSVVPDMNEIKHMAALYGQRPVLVWIDTPRHIAQQRLSEDAARKARVEDESVKARFDVVFKSTGDLTKDSSLFTKCLHDLL